LINNTLAAMQITNDCGSWWEGGPPLNITVRRSLISGPYQGLASLANNPSGRIAAITMMVEAVPSGMPRAPPGAVKDVLLEDNTFERLVSSAFYIGSALNVTIRRNVVNDIKLSPLFYCNSENVAVYNNKLTNYVYNSSLYDSACNSSLSTNINDASTSTTISDVVLPLSRATDSHQSLLCAAQMPGTGFRLHRVQAATCARGATMPRRCFVCIPARGRPAAANACVW
jgi:hypothetical protein